MKNADRINFYLAGLRQVTDGRTGAAPGVTSQQAASPAPTSPTADLAIPNPGPAGQAERPVAMPDQMQLHQLLRQLETRRQRSGAHEDLSPESTRKHQRQLVLGLVLAGIIIAAQATAVAWLYQRAELLLGRPLSPALLLTATAGDLNVTFRPSASAGDVAVLLRELDLQVVDGPDTGSRYVLRPEQNKDSKRDLNALRDRRDLVYSADPAY